uniref:Limulus clotting factor C n=1 Tax=Magallana gigas TaxID=29159 RepID=K1Q4H9_MAGGI
MRTGLSLLLLWSTRLIGSDAMLIRSNPSYVSVWRPMTANSEHSRLTLRHDLNEDPAYVKVEGRTDTGFIFPAFGSSQQDDDTGTLYGGVVFVYNLTHIDIFVSHINNNNRKRNWTAIYTGDESKWSGPKYLNRRYESIAVQAKVWRSRDLPPPTWSNTTRVTNQGCVNEILMHSLNRYPDLIVVQIRKGHTLSQGQVESLIAVADGWGEKDFELLIRDGFLTVTAWDLKEFRRNERVVIKHLKDVEADNFQIMANLASYNLINIQLHVLDGANRGFRFDGVGSVMNEAEPYGGLVYGYNDSMVAIWVPHLGNGIIEESKVAVFMLGKSWGSGFNKQMTNNVDIVIKVMDMLVPTCLLEVGSLKTRRLESSNHDKYNDSTLKFSVGDQITLTCKTGLYSSEQNVTMACAHRNNGSWDRHLPEECYKLCPDIDPTTLNTEIMQNDNTTRPGRTVLYACSPRYRHVSGDLIRRCRKDGSWSGTAPVCEECKCPCSLVGSVPIKSNETEKLKQRIRELRSSLSVQKNMTAKARRQKVCASDPRPSARMLGIVFCVGVLTNIMKIS